MLRYQLIRIIILAVSVMTLQTGLNGKELRSDFVPFVASDYPEQQYRIDKEDYRVGDVHVRVTQVGPRRWDKDKKFYCCRVWVDVFMSENQVYQYYLDDIDAVGSWYGIRVPEYQPLPHHLIVTKLGDYDGELLLISDEGNVTSTMGGIFLMSPGGEYLISIYYSDISGYAVVDGISGKELYRKFFDTNYLGDFYFHNEKLYYLVGAWDWDRDERWITKRIEHLDLKKMQAVISNVPESELRAGRKIEEYTKHLKSIQDCSCKKVVPRPVFDWKKPENGSKTVDNE